MNDKRPERNKHAPAPADAISHEEVQELKRDMRTARMLAWVREHQRTLMVAAVAVLILAVGFSLWTERVRTQREAAAVLYHQALTSPRDKKVELLKSVVRDYDATAYAVLARMLLARADPTHAAEYLQALLARHDLTPELATQARLDLAELRLGQGDRAAARSLLGKPVGTHYEQLRLYLLARAADSSAGKRDYLHKALAAVSHDETLKKAIERDLNAGTKGSTASR